MVYKCNDKIPADYDALVQCFKQLLHLVTPEQPLFIFLDGVDQLSPEDGALGMSWLPLELPAYVKIVISVSNEVKYRCYPILRSLLHKNDQHFVEVRLNLMRICQMCLSLFSDSRHDL